MVYWKEVKSVKDIYSGSETSEELYKEFVSKYGFDKVARGFMPLKIKEFLEGKRTYNTVSKYFDYSTSKPPYTDHARIFLNTKTNKRAFVFHSYFSIEVIQKKITKWVRERNLKVEFYSEEKGFYNPGKTTMVVITVGEV